MFDMSSYYEAESVRDAINALAAHADAEIVSGGTDVMIRVRDGKDAGRMLVSIQRIGAIKGIRLMENGDLWIGAGTTFHDITDHPLIQSLVPMLGEAVDTVGSPQIRNVATIGGNICNGATSADSAPTMWTLDAIVVLEGPDGERQIPICEFYTGPGKTVRERCEVCTGFIIRRENYENFFGVYIKYGKRRAMEISTLGCAVRVRLSEDKKRFADVRLGFGVAGPTPMRCRAAEARLTGCSVSDAVARKDFVRTALSEVHPRSSWRASEEFRLQLIGELTGRALAEAVLRAGGEANV